jgi:hypothetical protein
MMAPSEELSTGRPRRQTSDYSEKHRAASVDAKPDTSYSLTRTAARSRFDARTDEATRPAAPDPLDETTLPAATDPLPRGTHERASTRPGVSDPFDSRTPSNAQPLARLRPTRDVPVVPPPNRTMFGVAPGPQASPLPPPVPSIPPKPPTRQLPTQQRPPIPPTSTSSTTVATRPVAPTRPAPLDALELDTQPLVPATPSVSDASTLVEVDPDFAEEIDTATATAAASTARGMAPAKPNHTVLGVPVAPAVQPAAEPELVLQPSFPVAAAPPPPAPMVLEVTPRGLGIGTVAGFCEELIRRNSRVPAEMKKVFTTSRDRQDLVRIVICQGESRRLGNNTIIGDLVLQGLPPRPRGETSIEVTFTLDASGILQVHARDMQTNTEQHATLDLLGGVPAQDVAASRDRIQQLRR